MTTSTASTDTFLRSLGERARRADVFDDVEIEHGALRCAARGSAAPARYRVAEVDGRWNVLLETADRWLSESIETDLLHFGDPIEELVSEELAELGDPEVDVVVKHYRSDDLLYTFRSPLPIDGAGAPDALEVALRWLLAYEAAFRALGDMEEGDED